MDMDDAINVMKYCILAFAITMVGLGYVFTGNGADGLNAMDAQAACDRNPNVFGVDIGDDKHLTCGR